MTSILILSLVGAIVYAVIGTLWYSSKTPMGRIHMRYLGFDKLSADEQAAKMQEAKPRMLRMYVAQITLSFLTAFSVVFVVTMSMRNGLSLAMAIGFAVMNWLCFMVPTIGSAILWSNCDRGIAWKKFFSDISSNLVTILVIAYMASLFV